MSIKVMQLVWDSTIPAPERFTLLALANWANDDGYCWPSIAKLAKRCMASDRSIQRHIKTLEGMAVLDADRREGNEPRRSTRYQIHVPVLRRLAQPDDPPDTADGCQSVTGDNLTPVTDCPTTGDNLTGDGCQSVTPYVSYPSVDTSRDVAQALPSPPPAVDPPRDDVEALCHRMLDRLIALDFRPRPRITSEWRRQARLLLDVDGREPAKALRLIDWATADSFWSQNIHSIPTFRKQYEKLRMAALKEHSERNGTPLRAVPNPAAAPATFEEIFEAADVETARRLIRANYLMPDRPLRHHLSHVEWRRHCAREWITEHEASIRAALEDRKARA